ncbi:MAG: copper resistance CopC/CopD family protein [Gemmatimonadaceae bacterium]
MNRHDTQDAVIVRFTRAVRRMQSKVTGRIAPVAFAAFMLSFPVSASAHGGLKSSAPARDEVVTKPMREVRLEFTEKPELAFTTIRIIGPAGAAVELGQYSLTGNTLVVPLEAILSPGRYSVAWKTAGRDGHPVTGEFSFSVARGAAGSAPLSGVADGAAPGAMAPMEMHHDSAAMPDGRSFGSASRGYAAIRLAQFIALVTLLGAFAFCYGVLGLLRGRDPASPLLGSAPDGAARVATLAAWSLVFLAMARLIAQSYAMHGEDQPVFSVMLPMITGTVWGLGWLLQLAGCGLVIAGLGVARRRKEGWWLATIGAIALAFTPALSGHAASTPRYAFIAVVSDAIHVIGASGWLGSLLIVVVIGIPAAIRLERDQRGAAVANLVNAFSPTALTFAGITVVTGVLAAWLHVGSIPNLWETGYGRTLLLKLGVLSVVALTGAYNWLRVRPALGQPQSTGRLKQSATIELVIAILVLAVTAVLVATPTAMDEEMMQNVPPASSTK